MKTKNYRSLFLALGLMLILISTYNIFITQSSEKKIDLILDKLKEELKPAKIKLTTITDSSCTDCENLTNEISQIKSLNIELLEEKNLEPSSDVAQELIKRYKIKKLPAIIIKNDIEKLNIRGFNKKTDALVFESESVPYTEATTGKVKGFVNVTIITEPSCQECKDLTKLVEELKSSGVKFSGLSIVARNTTEGEQIVNKYGLTIFPTIIFSKDLSEYNLDLVKSWKEIGTIEEDGNFISRKISLPYYDIVEQRTVGLVNLTYVVSKDCKDCYKPEKYHKQILERIGVNIMSVKKVYLEDQEGLSYVKAYNITKFPTIILSGDMKEYPILVQAWNNVGSIEKDGSFVFRNVEFTGEPYLDIEKK
jgi:glutaredoxin